MNANGQTNKDWLVSIVRSVVSDVEHVGRVSDETLAEARAVLSEVIKHKDPANVKRAAGRRRLGL